MCLWSIRLCTPDDLGVPTSLSIAVYASHSLCHKGGVGLESLHHAGYVILQRPIVGDLPAERYDPCLMCRELHHEGRWRTWIMTELGPLAYIAKSEAPARLSFSGPWYLAPYKCDCSRTTT